MSGRSAITSKTQCRHIENDARDPSSRPDTTPHQRWAEQYIGYVIFSQIQSKESLARPRAWRHCGLVVSDVSIVPTRESSQVRRRANNEHTGLLFLQLASTKCLHLDGRRPRWRCRVIKQMAHIGKFRQLRVLPFCSNPVATRQQPRLEIRIGDAGYGCRGRLASSVVQSNSAQIPGAAATA
jgi:hypothetical protein